MDKSDQGSAAAVAEETTEAAPKVVDVSVRDEISDLGFRTDHVTSGFVAFELAGDRRVPEKGPGFKTDAELLRAVRERVQQDGLSVVEDPNEIVTELVTGSVDGAHEVWKAYRRGRPEIAGAGHTAELATEDLVDFAEPEAGITFEEDSFDAIEGIIEDEEDSDFPRRQEVIALDAVQRYKLFQNIGEDAWNEQVGLPIPQEAVDDRDPDELEEGQALASELNGQGILPGTEPIVDEQLARLAGRFKTENQNWKDAGKRRKEAADELTFACHQKDELFKQDPDNTNAKIYKVGGFVIRLKDETKEKVEVDEIGVEV